MILLFGQRKRGLLPVFAPETDPFVASFEKMEKRAGPLQRACAVQPHWTNCPCGWRKRTSARTPGFVPDFVKSIADAKADVKGRQSARKLTKKRNFSDKICPWMYILHEGT